jgi:hypothetical protein
MVPVIVAAAIGFGGGVGVGLSSALSGPTENADQGGATVDSRDRSSASLDQLAAAISPVVSRPAEEKKAPLGVPTGSAPTSPAGPSPVAPPPGSNTPSGTTTEATPQADPGITSGSSSGGSTTTTPAAPLTSTNPVGDLLNGLLGSLSGQ